MAMRNSMFRRSVLLASAGAGALSAGTVAAQTPPALTVASNATAAEGIASGEIVVTAQRRTERLQDVPLSITALSGAQLRNQDITDATRLEQVVPGLRLGRSGPATRPAIRGVYTEAVGINSDPRIGFYIDEIYQSRSQQGSAAFVDLERVEVQMGPQGTLFGRNSLGGNIALTTASPKDHVEGGITVTGGNYARGQVEAYYNQPIADGLAVRFSGSAERRDGYLKSDYNSRADLGDSKYYYGRSSLRWSPPSMDGRLEVLLHASYYHAGGHGYNNINAKVIGSLVDPNLIRQPGQSLTINGITYPFPTGYNGGNYATGTIYPYTTALRDNIPDVNGADIGIPVTGPYRTPYDYPAYQRLNSQNYSGTVNFDLTDWLRLRSITSYVKFKTVNVGDGDGGPVPIAYYYNITQAKTFTQEVQLQSRDTSSPLQYTLGAFYLNDRDFDAGALVNLHTYTTAGAAAAGQPVLYNSGSSCGFSYLPNTTSCAINNLNAADGAGPAHATTKSYAAYGQLSYKITDKLTLTGGVRYTEDKKFYQSVAQTSDFVGTYVGNQNAAYLLANPAALQAQLPFPNAASVPATRPNGSATGFVAGTGYHSEQPLASNSATFLNQTCDGVSPAGFAAYGSNAIAGTVPDYYVTRCGRSTFKFTTFRVAADYKLTPDNMLYASVSTGKHSGGFGTAPTILATNANPAFAPYGAEGVTAFEIGSKNKFFDGRVILNVAAYYNRYTHVQIQGLQFNPVTNGNFTTIYNGPTERAPGVDVDLVFKPTRALTMNVSVNYLHARYDVYPQPVYYSGLCTISSAPSGTAAAQNPCNGFSGASYIASMGGLGSGFFPNALTDPSLFVAVKDNNGNIIAYQSLVYNKTKVQNTPDIAVHFGASYDIDLGSHGRITPDFTTLFSGKYLLSASTPLFQQHSYFKTDARITYYTANERFSAQVFVNNITNIATIGRVTTAGLAASGTYDDPRTFGVKLGYRF